MTRGFCIDYARASRVAVSVGLPNNQRRGPPSSQPEATILLDLVFGSLTGCLGYAVWDVVARSCVGSDRTFWKEEIFPSEKGMRKDASGIDGTCGERFLSLHMSRSDVWKRFCIPIYHANFAPPFADKALVDEEGDTYYSGIGRCHSPAAMSRCQRLMSKWSSGRSRPMLSSLAYMSPQ